MNTSYRVHEGPGCAYTLSHALVLTVLIALMAAQVISRSEASKLQERLAFPEEE
jgi:hypothetical protein